MSRILVLKVMVSRTIQQQSSKSFAIRIVILKLKFDVALLCLRVVVAAADLAPHLRMYIYCIRPT